jgi:ElaB/YqjD/DUF883 family membrane-anchored ribosome-binding protein
VKCEPCYGGDNDDFIHTADRQDLDRKGTFPMSNAESHPGEPNDIQAQIAWLREQIDELMKERAAPSSGDKALCSEITVCCNAVKAVQQHAKELSGRVSERPLTALLIAASVGFVLGRAVP